MLVLARSSLRLGVGSALLLRACVAAHKLVHATGGVHQLALTSIEGVRGAADLQLYYGISLALEFHCLSGLASGTAQEHVTIAHILEHNGTIVLGMNTLFHIFLLFTLFLYVEYSW